MEIGKRLRELRESQGYSLSRLAHASGLSKSTLAAIETGKNSPTIETLSTVLQVLGISFHDFFAPEQDRIPPDIRRTIYYAGKLAPVQREALNQFLNVIAEPPQKRINDLIPRSEPNLARALEKASEIAYTEKLSDDERRELLLETVEFYDRQLTSEPAPFAAHASKHDHADKKSSNIAD